MLVVHLPAFRAHVSCAPGQICPGGMGVGRHGYLCWLRNIFFTSTSSAWDACTNTARGASCAPGNIVLVCHHGTNCARQYPMGGCLGSVLHGLLRLLAAPHQSLQVPNYWLGAGYAASQLLKQLTHYSHTQLSEAPCLANSKCLAVTWVAVGAAPDRIATCWKPVGQTNPIGTGPKTVVFIGS